jgi:ABC-2 type transport system ATP-binding protein
MPAGAIPGVGGQLSSGGDDSAVLYLSLVAGDPAAAPSSATSSAGDNGAAPATGAGDGTAAAGDVGSANPSSSGQGGISAALSALGSGPAGGAVAPIRIEHLPADGSPVTVTVRLPPVAFQIAAGKTLAVRVATTDQGYPAFRTPAAYRISLADAALGQGGESAQPDAAPSDPTVATQGTVREPVAGGTRITNDESPLWWALGVAAVVLAGILALALAGRSPTGPRRRGPVGAQDSVIPEETSATGALITRPAQPGSAEAAAEPDPLVVTGLRKEYPGGVTAVADVSFTVRRGQVLGLLGPNGAGKTTTLRMVMGLIQPTAGQIRLFGEAVYPGAPVLARVGSFVEGAGFLPHLSGRANLDLYWRATGRAAEASFMDEALAIAGLGGAISRKVRTYSQGMRQRLAIAQSMLGLPELLILDEPTNGLDPPQIHAMREVLRRYAATGRTVIISSHLLSEVEQTCTDVVIVSLGSTIAAGSVQELVSHSGDLLVSTPEPLQARAALSGLPGIGEFEVVPAGLAVDRGTVDVVSMMRALLDADVPLSAIAPRNRLEEVFLDLIATGEGAARV